MPGSKSQSDIERCIKALLRPTARFCVRHSVRIQEFIELFKQVLVEVAAQELERSRENVSVSRINVMTGVHRAEVARIYKHDEPRRKDESVVTRVLWQWQHDSRFQTQSGRPRVLDAQGMDSSFVQLVLSVSKDLNPYTILFEMERIGLIQKTAKGVKMLSPVALPKDKAEGFQLLADDAEDLLEAVQTNILESPAVPNLHVKTEYTNVPGSKMQEIREWFLREGASFHQKARNFLSKFDRDVSHKSDKEDQTWRVAVCTFSVTEQREEEWKVWVRKYS